MSNSHHKQERAPRELHTAYWDLVRSRREVEGDPVQSGDVERLEHVAHVAYAAVLSQSTQTFGHSRSFLERRYDAACVQFETFMANYGPSLADVALSREVEVAT